MSDSPKVIRSTRQVGAAQAYVEGVFGGPITETSTTYNLVYTTKTRVAANNPDRVGLTIINLDVVDAYIGLTNLVSTAQGLLLLKNGGFISMNVVQDMMLPAHEWYAVAGQSGSTVVYVLEVFRYALTYAPMPE